MKSDNNKNCDDLRLISAGFPAGGGWIVANRGSYSEMRRECKAVRDQAASALERQLPAHCRH
jgi:hypothetical protein